jgi:hypothetical protein
VVIQGKTLFDLINFFIILPQDRPNRFQANDKIFRI